jgi:anti-anti-sigma factor
MKVSRDCHSMLTLARETTNKDSVMDMQVSEVGGNVTCIRLVGRLDAPGADSIDAAFTTATVSQGRPTVVDLSGVSFIASMGLRLLIASARGLHLKGAKLVLFGAQALVYTVLDQAALDQIVPLVATQKQALDRLTA